MFGEGSARDTLIKGSARRSVLALLATFSVVAAACGASTSTPAGSAAPAATGSAAQTAAIATAAPVKTPVPMTKISVGVTGNVLPLAPAFIAKSKGYFAEEGLDVSIVTAPSLQCLTGVIANQFAFCASASQDVMVAVEKGEQLLVIAHMEPMVALNFILRSDVAARLKVTPESSLKDRLAALKGLTLAVTGVGGAANQALNMMIKEAGLQEKDVNIIPIAAQGAQLAALLEKQIDGVVAGPPLSDQLAVGGVGVILVPAGVIPAMAEIIYEGVYTSKKWADANPELAKATIRAIVKANKYLRTDPEAPKQMNATDWNSISTEILTLSLGRIRNQFSPDACITAAQATGLVKYSLAVGILTKSVDAAEGGFWSNKYNTGCK